MRDHINNDPLGLIVWRVRKPKITHKTTNLNEEDEITTPNRANSIYSTAKDILSKNPSKKTSWMIIAESQGDDSEYAMSFRKHESN